MQETETFRLARHGAYVHDIRGVRELFRFEEFNMNSNKRAQDIEQVHAILLGLIQRAYPQADASCLYNYHNKAYTFVGQKFGSFIAIYRHDWAWCVVDIPIDGYRKWREGVLTFNGAAWPAEVPTNLPWC